jgi:hypothetical protein
MVFGAACIVGMNAARGWEIHLVRLWLQVTTLSAQSWFRVTVASGIELLFDWQRAGDMKGDRVEIVVDDGGGNRTYEVAATRAGRRVEVANRRGLVEVSEVTRTGTPVRTARFMSSRIIALVEYPASDRADGPAPG